MRLIDETEYQELLAKIPMEERTFRRAVEAAEDMPTIDAVPVKRGIWKLNKDGSGTCDQCHFTQKSVWDFDGWQNFCGVCGADMRERKDGEG